MPFIRGVPKLIDIPSQEGTYILFLQLAQSQSIYVGRYGLQHFPLGIYAYAGSALGKGGLSARLKHHLEQPQEPHWHIDWVRPFMQWVGLYYETSSLSTECTWSKRLSKFPGSQVIIPGFGASDCGQGCLAHFYRFKDDVFDPGHFVHYFKR
jgi:Uri superfamily endonuclease